MKKGNNCHNHGKKLNNNNFYNTTSFKNDDFRKIDNTCLAKSVSNKSAIIIFQKEVKKRNQKRNQNKKKSINNFCDSYKNSVNNDKRNKTLNNTFYKNNNSLKINNNNSINNNNKIKNINNNVKKCIKLTNYSSENYSPIEGFKKFKNINKIISTNDTNNNITNISVCLTNINMYNKNNENYSPSFCKINKKIKKNAQKNNINSKNKIRSKTFDYNFINCNEKINIFNNTLFKDNEKNKTLMEKKMRYFLDYCKDDIESILKSNSIEEEKDTSQKYIKNYRQNNQKIKKIKHRSKSNISLNKSINNYKTIDKKKYYNQNRDINNKLYNTFNYGKSHLSELNSNFYSHNISTINNKIKKNNSYSIANNGNNKKQKQNKPRVDTFEYLAKILNSINTNNLMKSLEKVKKNEEKYNKINKKNKNNEQTDFFRKRKNIKNNNKNNNNKSKDNKETRNKKDDINKYIENKKKLFKINYNQKKQKEKEEELKKYFELYKLQENLFNTTYGNTFNDTNKINSKLLSKTKNDFYCGKINKNIKDSNKKNNNEIISSTESTIIDKNNYYQGILDIQNLYNKNNLILIKNNSELNLTQNNENENENSYKEINNIKHNSNNNNIVIKNNDNTNYNITKKVNASHDSNNKEDNIELKHINLEINDNIQNDIKKNIDNEDIFVRCQNTLEKANKIIGGEKVECLINNFKNIHFSNEEEKEERNEEKKDETKEEEEKEKEEDHNNNKEFIINDFRNDYSFKLNDSNSNDINSYQTSKFCNSLIFSDEKGNDEIEKTDTIKENNEERKEKNNIVDKNDIKEFDNKCNDDNNEIKNNVPSIQLPPTIQNISCSDTMEENKNKNEKMEYNFDEEKLENYKEILTSLFEYLKLITQRNALNDIITYGDMKYKYRVGFEQLIILIKSIPFNIIRAIQQRQYYNFVFRQLFIPYIARAFHKLQLYSFYYKLFIKESQIIKFIFKKLIFKKLKNYKKNKENENKNTNDNLELNKKSINSNMTIKSLEDLPELKDSINQKNNNKKNEEKSKKKKKTFDSCTDQDISESREIDSIEWDNNFLNEKQLSNRDNSNIINKFTKINNNNDDKNYSADFNISIQEIVFEEQNQ